MQPIVFDLDQIPLYEAAAEFLVSMAYPEPDAEPKRKLEVNALCCQFARAAYAANPTGPKTVNAAHVFGAPDRSTVGTKRFEKRLRQRLLMGALAFPFIREALGADVDIGFPFGKRDAIRQGMAVTGVKDERTFRKRQLNPALPVIHLSVGFYFVHALTASSGAQSFTIVDLTTDRELFTSLIRAAEQFEPAVAEWGPPGFDPEFQFKFRIASQGAIGA